jgi:hypothetical protein
VWVNAALHVGVGIYDGTDGPLEAVRQSSAIERSPRQLRL